MDHYLAAFSLWVLSWATISLFCKKKNINDEPKPETHEISLSVCRYADVPLAQCRIDEFLLTAEKRKKKKEKDGIVTHAVAVCANYSAEP